MELEKRRLSLEERRFDEANSERRIFMEMVNKLANKQ